MSPSQDHSAGHDPYGWDLAAWGGPPSLDHASDVRDDQQLIEEAWREPGAHILCLDDERRDNF